MAAAGGLLGGGIGGGAGTAPVNFNNENEQTEEPNVSEEEQAEYNKFVNNALELVYTQDGKVQPEVLARLSTGKQPMKTVAQTLVWIVMIVEKSAADAGAPLSDGVVFHGSAEILEALIEVCDASEIHDFSEGETQGAWYQALDMYREANSDEGGRFNQEEAAADFMALNEADKEGRAEEMIPGFYSKIESSMGAAMADGAQGEDDEEEEM